MSKRRQTFVVLALGFLFLPNTALAQSAIAGIVKDTTGAVLPGVTVEASSPALIEKVRTTTSDENGQYRVIDLRPGTYTVTFTLAGFSTIVRAGIVLETNFTAPINVELRVGEVAESITVTGETPVVDVQTSSRRDVMSREFLDAVPSGRNYMWMANAVPAVSASGFDVGGSATMWSGGALTVHGSTTADARTLIDGMIVDGMMGTGQCACIYDNEMQTQEIAVQVGGGSAENQLGGVIVNRIPRTGSNNFSGDEMFLGSVEALQSQNINDEQKAKGISVPGKLYRQYDINYSIGGPILKDRLWFFFTGRNWAYDQYAANSFKEDGTQYADLNILQSYPFRLTSQLTKNNKLTALYNWASREKDNYVIPGPTRTPASITGQSTPTEYIAQVKWTSTLRPSLLLEAGYNLTNHHIVYSYKDASFVTPATCFTAFALCAPGTSYGSIPHRDTLTGVDSIAPFPGTGAGQGPEDRPTESHTPMVSLTYVSGAHALKVGFQDRFGPFRQRRFFNGDIGQQYRNGVPFAVTVLNSPTDTTVNVNHDMGIYLQDTWTTKRLTLSPGIRYDHFNSSIPAQTKPAGRFVGEQHFEAIPDTPNWHNVVPRIGGAFDVFGNGKTAVKGNWGIYMSGQGPGFAQNYNPSFPALETRNWTDLNRDDIAQENELGPGSPTFGIRRNQNMDPDVKRPYQHLWDAGVQHEVRPGFALSVTYAQRNIHEDLWTDNLAIVPSDYILLNVPDPRGNGQTLPVYNLPANKFGLINELDTNSSLNTRVYRGVDVGINVRIAGGGVINAGTSTGRSTSFACEVENLNSLRFCDQSLYDIPLQTNFKMSGSYPVPFFGLRVSGMFQSLPGSERSITYQVTRTLLPTLTAASVNVRLNEPGTVYNQRVNQLDFSLSKSFKRGNLDLRPQLTLFNALNANPATSVINAYGSSLDNISAVLNPRLLQLGMIVKF
jgi:hypothetical protein